MAEITKQQRLEIEEMINDLVKRAKVASAEY